MTLWEQRDFLQAQLLETQRLLRLAADHPIMSVAYTERERELQEQIDALPSANSDLPTEPSPVIDTEGRSDYNNLDI